VSLASRNNILQYFFPAGVTVSSDTVKGRTGFYLANIQGKDSGITNNIVSGWTLSQFLGVDTDGMYTSGSVLTLKNINTTSNGIDLSFSRDDSDIVVKYTNYNANSGITGTIVGGGSGNSFLGITGTSYDNVNNVFDIPIRSYYERITNIDSVLDSGIVVWNLNASVNKIFQLRPRLDACDACEQLINIIVPSLNIPTGITIIIPSGVTEKNTTTSWLLNNSIRLNFPLNIIPKLSNNLDVVNVIDTYASFVLWNASSNTINPTTGITKDYYNTPPNLGIICTTPNLVQFLDTRICGNLPPTLTSITPNVGSTGGGTDILITGTNLQGATLTIGGITLTSTNNLTGITLTSTTIAVDVSGPKSVRIYTPSLTSGVGGLTFTYYSSVSLTSVNPNSGPTGGG
jgi:hypothetical protein